jgi:hypothetical protein
MFNFLSSAYNIDSKLTLADEILCKSHELVCPDYLQVSVMYSNLLTVSTSFSEQNGIPVTRWFSMVQLKIQSVKLARKYLGRVSAELEATQGGPDEEELMLQ